MIIIRKTDIIILSQKWFKYRETCTDYSDPEWFSQ